MIAKGGREEFVRRGGESLAGGGGSWEVAAGDSKTE